jgi:crotonobetainyl-CoA:carnitine CoA-transferase CaiB-like acyl-CoA transferase
VVDSDARFAALARTLELPRLAQDARFATRESRRANDAALIQALEAKFREKSAAEWFAALDAAGVPCEIPIEKGPEKLFNTPEYLETGIVAEYPHSTLGRMREIALGVRYSETPGVSRKAAPLIGEETREILRELGYSEAQMEALKAAKAVTWTEAPASKAA